MSHRRANLLVEAFGKSQEANARYIYRDADIARLLGNTIMQFFGVYKRLLRCTRCFTWMVLVIERPYPHC